MHIFDDARELLDSKSLSPKGAYKLIVIGIDSLQCRRQFMGKIDTPRRAGRPGPQGGGSRIVGVDVATLDLFNEVSATSEKLRMREFPFLIFRVRSSRPRRLHIVNVCVHQTVCV